MSESSLESRVAAIEEIVTKDGQGIDDALLGYCLVGQAQAQIIGDFSANLGQLLHDLMVSMGQVYQAFGGEFDEETGEDSGVSSGPEPESSGPSLTVIDGGSDGDT